MKVPVGDFGYKVAQTAPGADARASINPHAFDNGGAELKAAADEQMKIEKQKLVLAERERAANEEQARRNQAATAFAEYQVGLNEATADIGTRLNEGKVTRDAARTELEETIAKLKKDRVDGLDQKSKALLADNLILFDGKARMHFQGVVQEHAKRERVSTYNEAREGFQRLALTDSAAAIRGMETLAKSEGAALFGADKAGRDLQNFREQVVYTEFDRRIGAAKGSASALKAVEADLAKADIAPERRGALESRVINFQERLAAQGARAEASRLATLQHQVQAVDSLILKGYEPDAATMDNLIKASKGTPYAATVQQQVAFAKQTASFRAAPPVKQEQFINQLEAQVRANPTPAGVSALESMKTIRNAQAEEIKKDPISYAARNGLAEVQPLDISNPASLGDQLNARLSVARGMKTQYRAPMNVVTEQEAGLIAESLNGLQAPQKVLMLQTLTKKINDPEAIRALATQIAPKDQHLATGMILAARDLQTTKGRTVAELYFKGREAITQNTAKIDPAKETGVRAEIAKGLDGVYATPEGKERAIEATLGVYAGLKAEGTDDVSQALRLTTGGTKKHNGGVVAKPYGWEDSRFTDALEKVTAADLQRMGGGNEFRIGKNTVTAEDLRKQLPAARLQTVGDGQYAIQSDAGYVRRPDGKPLVLDLVAPSAQQVAPPPPAPKPEPLAVARDKNVDRDRKKKP